MALEDPLIQAKKDEEEHAAKSALLDAIPKADWAEAKIASCWAAVAEYLPAWADFTKWQCCQVWPVGPDLTFDRARSNLFNVVVFIFLLLWTLETQFVVEPGSFSGTAAGKNLYLRGIIMCVVTSPIFVVNNAMRDLSFWRWVGAGVLGIYFYVYLSEKDDDLSSKNCDGQCKVHLAFTYAMLAILSFIAILFVRIVATRQDAYLARKTMNEDHIRGLLKNKAKAERAREKTDGDDEREAEPETVEIGTVATSNIARYQLGAPVTNLGQDSLTGFITKITPNTPGETSGPGVLVVGSKPPGFSGGGAHETRAQIFLGVQERLKPFYVDNTKALMEGCILVVNHIEETRRKKTEEASILEILHNHLERVHGVAQSAIMGAHDNVKHMQEADNFGNDGAVVKLASRMGDKVAEARNAMAERLQSTKNAAREVYAGVTERDFRKAANAMIRKQQGESDKQAERKKRRLRPIDAYKYLPSIVHVSFGLVLLVMLGTGVGVESMRTPANDAMQALVQQVNPDYALAKIKPIEDQFYHGFKNINSTLNNVSKCTTELYDFSDSGVALLKNLSDANPDTCKIDPKFTCDDAIKQVEAIRAKLPPKHFIVDQTKQFVDEMTDAIDQGEEYDHLIRLHMRTIYKLMKSLYRNFPQAYIIANGVATLASLSFLFRSLWAFRNTQMQLRRGTYFKTNHPNSERYHAWSAFFSVAKSQRYIGLLLGSIVSGYIFVFTLVLFGALVLMWEETWNYLLRHSGHFAAIIVTFVYVLLWDRFVVHAYLSNGFWIQRPVQWTWFQAFAIVMATVTGLYFSIIRLVLLLVFGLGSMFCLDFSIYPESFKWLDKGYASYMSMALMTHRHRSPILSALCSDWFDQAIDFDDEGGFTYEEIMGRQAAAKPSRDEHADADDPPGADSTGRERAGSAARTARQAFKLNRNRWQLAYTLLNNPQVIPFRGSAVSASV